jgi:hypothetical protein
VLADTVENTTKTVEFQAIPPRADYELVFTPTHCVNILARRSCKLKTPDAT